MSGCLRNSQKKGCCQVITACTLRLSHTHTHCLILFACAMLICMCEKSTLVLTHAAVILHRQACLQHVVCENQKEQKSAVTLMTVGNSIIRALNSKQVYDRSSDTVVAVIVLVAVVLESSHIFGLHQYRPLSTGFCLSVVLYGLLDYNLQTDIM